MKIIIEVKDTATLSRIDEFSKLLECNQKGKYPEWADVIKLVYKEWEQS